VFLSLIRIYSNILHNVTNAITKSSSVNQNDNKLPTLDVISASLTLHNISASL